MNSNSEVRNCLTSILHILKFQKKKKIYCILFSYGSQARINFGFVNFYNEAKIKSFVTDDVTIKIKYFFFQI